MVWTGEVGSWEKRLQYKKDESEFNLEKWFIEDAHVAIKRIWREIKKWFRDLPCSIFQLKVQFKSIAA